jgi:hypothetical protein
MGKAVMMKEIDVGVAGYEIYKDKALSEVL